MTSKQPKKSNKKKAPVKKASAKKAPAKKDPVKKASASKKTTNVRPEDSDRLLAKISEPKQQFANAEKFMKVMAEQTAVIRVNDVKSLPLRKKMLAWFKISK
jgi:hypothetical protein